MIKVVAVGDVHGMWAELWRVLKTSAAATPQLEPTPALIEGRVRVVCIGDLVHYKDERAYAAAAGVEPYDPDDPDHLRRAAKAQIRELGRFKRFVEAAQGHVHVILGNHDDAALHHRYGLSSGNGLRHDEFDPERGGVSLPSDLSDWFETFPREVCYHGVQFAHAGPTPGLQQFDDFFYHAGDAKRWWFDQPELVRQSGHRFGVYGHTVMKEGIYVDREHGFAMIDALSDRQFLEMFLDDDRLDYSVTQL